MSNIFVIIPTYQPQEYLKECLDSLYAQTLSKNDFEVILILNGDREPYESQIREYLSNYPMMNIDFIQTDVVGVSNARNIGLDTVFRKLDSYNSNNYNGKYVAFIDDDDFVSPTYLGKLYSIATPDTIPLSNNYSFEDGLLHIKLQSAIDKNYCEGRKKGILKYPNARKYFNGAGRKLIPITAICNNRFDCSLKNSEDALFMFLLSNRFDKVAFTSPEATYYRRIRKNSASNTIKTVEYTIKNALILIKKYSVIYFVGKGYSFCFFLTRILGTLKTVFIDVCRCVYIKQKK